MTILLAWLACCLAAAPPPATSFTANGLAVTIGDDGGWTVRHQATGRLWRSQPPAQPPALALPRLTTPPTIDGNLSDWPLEPLAVIGPQMTGDLARIDGPADCSAKVHAGWDETGVWLAVEVTDDQVVFPVEPNLRWWDTDSVEVWLGGTQIGFALSQTGAVASRIREEVAGCQVAVSPGRRDPLAASGLTRLASRGAVRVAQSQPGGYLVEALIPWTAVGAAPPAAEGDLVRFAVGVNDADATGVREGQIYFPATWTHSQPGSFAAATLAGPGGRLPGQAMPAQPALISGARPVPGGVAFRQRLTTPAGAAVAADVQVTSEPTAAGLRITVDLPDRTQSIGQLAWPPPLVSDLDDGQVCLAPYANGLLLPWTGRHMANRIFWGSSLDLPFVGLVDQTRGDGYLLLLETPWDGGIKLATVPGPDGGQRLVPQAVWDDQLGTFAEPRVMRLIFVESGGYVACAKAYRQYAAAEGLVLTLAEKRKLRPVERLGGAPNIWGGSSTWADEAWAHGVTEAIVNVVTTRERTQRVNDLGYLSSRYDNYVDLLVEEDEAKWDHRYGSLDHVLVNADGSHRLGWLTWDKATQYFKRSPAYMRQMAERVIPRDLAERPYNARFLDVTTAEGVYEDWHPQRRLSREAVMRAKVELYRYLNELGLVTGGEHGRFYAVPQMDYFEGMMSGGHYSWPAGHLRTPDDGLAGISDAYREYGIGAVRRIPLWELVFGDCVVDYWYWGDSTGYLHQFDPGITDRKDALNVLYGTPPMYWVSGRGLEWSRPELRQRLLESYRRTCRWHREVWDKEMLSHEALTADRLVQRTRFAGGYTATVNFAPEPRQVTDAGGDWNLAPEGFVATGPGFRLEYLSSDGGRRATRIESTSYHYVDGAGATLATAGIASDGQAGVLIDGPERLRVPAGNAPCRLDLAGLVPGWDLAGTRAFELVSPGERVRAVELAIADGVVTMPATTQMIEIATGSLTAAPDLRLAAEQVSWPAAPRQAEPLELTVTVGNRGGEAVAGALLTATIEEGDRAEARVDLPARGQATARLRLDLSRVDGSRNLLLTIAGPAGGTDAMPADNRLELTLDIAADRTRWLPEPVASAVVTGAAIDLLDPVVELPLTVPAGVTAASLRAVDVASGHWLPCQYEPGDRARGGVLAVRLPGPLPAGSTRRLQVLGAPAAANLLPPGGGFARDDGQRIETPVYGLALGSGVPHEVRVKSAPDPDRPVIALISYSSGQTGWVNETGETTAYRVLADGPVRTVVEVERNLAGGVVRYRKRYTFGPDAIRIETAAEPTVGSAHNRHYYLRPADYHDSLGRTTWIDGRGDDDDKLSGARPEWVAVLGEGWSQAIIPLGEVGGLTYWDGSSWGGLALSETSARSDQVLVFGPGAPDPSFAAAARERWRTRPTVVVE